MDEKLASLWAAKSDEDVLAAADLLWEFTADAQAVITAELQKRGLADRAPKHDVFTPAPDRRIRLIEIGKTAGDARWIGRAKLFYALVGLGLALIAVTLFSQGQIPIGFAVAGLSAGFLILAGGFARHASWAPALACALALVPIIFIAFVARDPNALLAYAVALAIVSLFLIWPAFRAWRYRRTFRGRLSLNVVRPRQARMFQTWKNWRKAAPFLIAMPAVPAVLLAIELMTGIGFQYERILMILWPILLLAARRRSTIVAPDLLTYTSEPPIIYLRSFADDELKLGHGLGERGSVEEAITSAFAYLGPVIAIGRPGESARPVGAARDYVSNEEWQERVAGFIESAQLIVLLAGTTEGLQWELGRVTDLKSLHKLIIVLPPGERRTVARRWLLTAHHNPAFAGLSPEIITERTLMIRVARDGELLVAVGNGSGGVADYFEAARALAMIDEDEALDASAR